MNTNKNRKDYEAYRSIRKPMPPPSKVILNDKDLKKNEKFDWRKELIDKEKDNER